MTGTRIMTLCIALWVLSTPVLGIDRSPDEIQKRVAAAYKALDTYKAEGTITMDMGLGGTQHKVVTSFTILMKKPNLYLITWSKNMPRPGMGQSGAVWSDGTQPYLYMSAMHGYSKVEGDQIALGSATGISGGAAFTVPSLFLPVYMGQPQPFSRLKDPVIEMSDQVGDEACYVLTGPSSTSKKETYWISKGSHLIRQYSRSLETPEGGVVMPELTDEQLEQALTAMGQEVTQESKDNMKEMLEKSRAMLKTTKLTGSTTELHVKVSFPALSKSDFKFTLPEDAVLKDSLFEGMLKASETLADRTKDTP